MLNEVTDQVVHVQLPSSDEEEDVTIQEQSKFKETYVSEVFESAQSQIQGLKKFIANQMESAQIDTDDDLRLVHLSKLQAQVVQWKSLE